MKRKRPHFLLKGLSAALAMLVATPLPLWSAILAPSSSKSATQSQTLRLNARTQSAGPVRTKEKVNPGQLTDLSTDHTYLQTVDELDQLAFVGASMLYTALQDPSTSPDLLYVASKIQMDLEEALDVALDEAWGSYAQPSGALWIHQPLQLAFLHLHIELRRRLGPHLHTKVPGLTEDPGCMGDWVADRLVYQYGSAASHPIRTETSDGLDAGVVALGEMATQIACVGAQQLAQLERAMTEGFESVSDRLNAHGLQDLISSYTTLVAPMQVLLLDARKHRGESSEAWQWFAAYGDFVDEVVGLAGWPTKELLLWDRRRGSLVGIPACTSGSITAECVDLRLFLETLQDPRALGLGGCAFAGMVSKPPQEVDEDPRYTCPAFPCQEDSRTSSSGPFTGSERGSSTLQVGDRVLSETGGSNQGAIGTMASGSGGGGISGSMHGTPNTSSSELDHLQSVWPQLGRGDLELMKRMCLGGSPTDLQGLNFDPTSCFTLSTEDSTPFESHLTCFQELVGSGDPPVPGTELKGVPTGTQCGLMDGEVEAVGPDGPTPRKPEPDPQNDDGSGDGHEAPEVEDKRPWEVTPNELDVWRMVIGSNGQDDQSNVDNQNDDKEEGTQEPEMPWWARIIMALGSMLGFGYETTALSKKGAEGGMGWLEGKTMLNADKLLGDLKITTGQYNELKVMNPADRDKAIRNILKQDNKECFDPTACNDCTALSKQINAVNACNEGLINGLLTGAGIGRHELGEERWLGPFINPNPEQAPSDDEVQGGECLGAQHNQNQPTHCGLILCSDSLSAANASGGCTCSEGPGAGAMPMQDLCVSVRCADGSVPGPDCDCPPVDDYGTQPPSPSPGPDPALSVTPSPNVLSHLNSILQDGTSSASEGAMPQTSPLNQEKANHPGDLPSTP